MPNTSRLFHGPYLSDALSQQDEKCAREINSLSESRLLNTSDSDLLTYLVGEYGVASLEIQESEITVDYGEAKVDVSRRFEYAIMDRTTPTYVQGTRISFHIPFTGDAGLFDCRPSRSSVNPPRAALGVDEVVFHYEETSKEVHQIHEQFKNDMERLKRYIDSIAQDVREFNSTLESHAAQLLQTRKEKLLNDRAIVDSLGFPLRRRSDAPRTFVAPEIKRAIIPRLPAVTQSHSEPEPILEIKEYEHILSVISQMVTVMERSPQAFERMAEEELRQHFLVQLNGQYEGQATGETFNYEGKTDILIRVASRNIFIAECKFWQGASGLSKAVDQLLGYTSWRDTKIALLVFNRDREMTTVLKAIKQSIPEHPHFQTEHDYPSETGFRYTFSHRDDQERMLTLTVLVFDVPGETTGQH